MAKVQKKSINLALQGGGSYGAYTWGVLDYFMEDGRISIEGISGTSAGAMNAVVLAHGFMEGGAQGARDALERFWKSVSDAGALSPMKPTLWDRWMGSWSLDNSPFYLFYDLLSRISSPYETNPLNINPLQDILEEQVDFEQVRACKKLRLFISATNVHTGKIKVFERDELSCDQIMASACLPGLYQAVEIDGEPYWDGGYVGNPALYPLFHGGKSKDIVIVQINPIERKSTPKTAREIDNRMNEISFNTSLLRELRAIDFVQRLLASEKIDDNQYARLYMHRIEATEALNPLSASSKLNADWAFLQTLKEIGRDTAKAFLDQHFDQLGHAATLDLKAEFN